MMLETSNPTLSPAAPDTPSASAALPVRHGLSVDVEDYFQVWGFSSVVDRTTWDDYDPRVGESTREVLDLFDGAGVKGTFFTLGWVAERDPQLIREIVARGHELASHGYDHTKVFDQTASAFREDITRTKAILEDVSGAPIGGYRAAGFSIDQRTPFAYEELAAAGYRYSSSTHPIAHDHYGDPNAPQVPFHPLAGDPFLEAPVATATVLGRRVSCAGGGWFRAMPYAASKKLFAQAADQHGGQLIFYFHPWEIDQDQPRVANAPLKSRLRHYLNLSTMKGKLHRLLTDFSWDRIDQIIQPQSSTVAA
ncbi:MAG: XrtA system polysaccharide deacetylase [Pseudomonadota bacterium]